MANKIKNHHQTVLSREEYFYLYPAPDADGWIEHDGKHEPAISTSGLTIWCKWSDGLEQSHEANMVDWIDDSDVRIIAYRLHKPEQSKPEFCESVMRSSPEPDEQVWTNPPTIEQLAADYRNAKDYAERKQQEADDAKADAKEKLNSLVAAGNALGLDVSPTTDQQERLASILGKPELVITDWRDLQVGDEVEYLDGGMKNKIGMVGTIDKFDHNSCTDRFFRIKDGYNFGWPTKWRFISRP